MNYYKDLFTHKYKSNMRVCKLVFLCLILLFNIGPAKDPDPLPIIVPSKPVVIPTKEEHERLINPAQKIADDPKDKRVEIKIGNATYCYVPVFTSGEGYWYVGNCSNGTIQGRYDVFGRIAFKLNSKWVCITAPESVTGYEGGRTWASWGHAHIRPCTLNDLNQRWKIKDNAFYTLDEKYRLQDYKWYLVVSKPSRDFTQHTISSTMNEWINTLAKPATLMMKTVIAWSFITGYDWTVYYLHNNQSYADFVTPFYYNPENGHIAQYYWENGAMSCMSSNNGKSNWSWVVWVDCNDDVPKNKDALYFEPFVLNENTGALKDKDGNVLRIAQYGYNWGVPYMARKDYLGKDTDKSPKSLFILSSDMNGWNRFYYGSLGDNLTYCPSPGKYPSSAYKSGGRAIAYTQSPYDLEQAKIRQSNRIKNGKTHPDFHKGNIYKDNPKVVDNSLSSLKLRALPDLSSLDNSLEPTTKPDTDAAVDNNTIPSDERYPDEYVGNVFMSAGDKKALALPPTFTLSEAWIRRLYDIATTADGTAPLAGVCGVCMLHTYQMIAELSNNYRVPPTRGGYFFDTQRGANPFVSFRRRFPELATRLDEIDNFFEFPLRAGETNGTRLRRVAYATSLAMMPQNDWAPSDMGENEREIRNIVRSLFGAPVGTLWLYASVGESHTGATVGHAQPLIRVQGGIIAVPTNAPSFSLESYRRALAVMNNADDIMNFLTSGGIRRLDAFGVFRLLGQYERPIDEYLSLNNCSGEGPGRRGNARTPAASFVNQCTGGRCAIQ